MSAEKLRQLREEAAACRACPLWQGATQTVFGEGPADARLMLVGEQPGDREDRAGHVFVGPAGRVLDQALEIAGIERSAIFLTNAVKHFKYRARGKRRIHQRPTAGEIKACRPWLEGELGAVAPEIVVALGAIAAHALIGRVTPVGANRGRPLDSPLIDAPVVITVHPASIVRERDRRLRYEALRALGADLALAASVALTEPAPSVSNGARRVAPAEEVIPMATTRQRSAAKRNVKKAQAGARSKQTLKHLPSRTKKALGEEANKVRKGETETRKDLESKARKLDIKGRSKMGKDELRRAIARAR
jgi:uracil-DNA glycosylase